MNNAVLEHRHLDTLFLEINFYIDPTTFGSCWTPQLSDITIVGVSVAVVYLL